jgi:hypothetical protein
MKPAVLIVGADKGGVGKTTVSRTVLDYLRAKNTPARAFDAEFPRGALKRFHPGATEIVDLTQTPDQMKILDTLVTTDAKVTLIDIRAGLLSGTLKALQDIGFFEAVRAGEFSVALFLVLGPSVASLDEIDEVQPYMSGGHYYAIKNFINDTSFFDWDKGVRTNYLQKIKAGTEITIPKLTEMACEQVELAGVPFSTFIGNKTAQGRPANYSLVLRGYVRTWLMQVAAEYERVGFLRKLLPLDAGVAAGIAPVPSSAAAS